MRCLNEPIHPAAVASPRPAIRALEDILEHRFEAVLALVYAFSPFPVPCVAALVMVAQGCHLSAKQNRVQEASEVTSRLVASDTLCGFLQKPILILLLAGAHSPVFGAKIAEF